MMRLTSFAFTFLAIAADIGLCWDLHPRADWNARPATKPKDDLLRPVGLVVVHHTRTDTCNDLASCTKVLKTMQNHQMDVLGLPDVRYNYFITSEGGVYEGVGPVKAGLHAKGYDQVSYGITFIGDFDSEVPNDRMKEALNGILGDLVKEKYLKPEYQICGYRDISDTGSPGINLYSYIKTLPRYRKQVNRCDHGLCWVWHPRADWGAKTAIPYDDLKTPLGLVMVHHTVTSACYNLSQCTDVLRAIQDHHMDSNVWPDIGYHYLIGSDGGVYEGIGPQKVGSHAYGCNKISYGIAFIGNYNIERLTDLMKEAFQGIIGDLVKYELLTPQFKIGAFRDVTPTSSPGNNVYKYLTELPNYQKLPAKCGHKSR